MLKKDMQKEIDEQFEKLTVCRHLLGKMKQESYLVIYKLEEQLKLVSTFLYKNECNYKQEVSDELRKNIVDTLNEARKVRL